MFFNRSKSDKKYYFQIFLYRSTFGIHLAMGNEQQNLFTLRNGNIDEHFKCAISQIDLLLVQNILKFMIIRAKRITKITSIPAKL